jgi:hypothetical protein
MSASTRRRLEPPASISSDFVGLRPGYPDLLKHLTPVSAKAETANGSVETFLGMTESPVVMLQPDFDFAQGRTPYPADGQDFLTGVKRRYFRQQQRSFGYLPDN